MNNFAKELCAAWKSGKKEITMTWPEFCDSILMSPHTGNEKVSFENHAECPSLLHEVKIMTDRETLMTGHYANYRGTLKIMVVKQK